MSHFVAQACLDFPLSLQSETHAGITADKVNGCLLIDSRADGLGPFIHREAGDPAILRWLNLGEPATPRINASETRAGLDL